MATDFAPHDLTSDASHSPYSVSASSAYYLSPEWHAFDGVASGPYTNTWLGTGGGVDWLQLDTGGSYYLGSYAINVDTQGGGEPLRAPNSWTMQGSNDGATWTTLDTQAGQTSWAGGETRAFTIASVGPAYRYYRLNITSNNGDTTYTQVAELYLYEPAGTTAQTITFPAITGPTLAATASSGLTVDYVITSGAATVSGSTLTISGAGTIIVQATQPGNATYAAATPVSQSFTVVDFAPHDLTSDTSHSPYVASASSETGGAALLCFDALAGNGLGDLTPLPGWFQLDTGAGNAYVLSAYAFHTGALGTDQIPVAWTMEGSPDGTTWTTLDTQSGRPNVAGYYAFPALSSTAAFRYFRLNITAVHAGTWAEVDELYLFGNAGTVTPAQRGNIAYDQIKASDRTGNGHQLLTYSTAPATSGATGAPGQIAYDGSFFYLCVAANTWMRATLVTW